MFSTFDLRLLLYVIRLAGWLKHCNLSLSLDNVLKHLVLERYTLTGSAALSAFICDSTLQRNSVPAVSSEVVAWGHVAFTTASHLFTS